ncbi:MAG TPA: NAD(P)-dependent oxidoreductase [Nocardioidaceae bacterium]|nr:NAD(P)-dependent oxidoreductase [Nocardioidaceae bacterium]
MSVTSDGQRLGWIGAGRMGAAMVRRLVDAGRDVAIYNRTRSKADAVARGEATVADRPVELADRDVVFTMVSASADFEAVVLGPDGLLSGDGPAPRVLVDSSTVSSESSQTVRDAAAERGMALLAAPVSGNPSVVAAGQLTLAVSGPRAAYDDVLPILDQLGRGVTYVGEGEVARLVKICHNVLLGVVTQSLAEITLLAQRGGTSREAFLAFLNDSVMGSTFSRYKTPALVNLDFTPTFTNPLLLKDFELGLDAGRKLGVPMPVAALAAQLVASAIGAGYDKEDFATLLLEQARRSGVELTSENADISDGLDAEDT